ncbi:MAG: hypothetical protein K9M49_01005, partial [Candidatus Marinimicrobia bacterium]|nr:hypothetical protein [Candidatus Neomarinimicrobiota bacterium]
MGFNLVAMQQRNDILNLIRISALAGILLITSLILMQAFHHHSFQDEQSCKWHNIIPASFLLIAILGVPTIIVNVSQSTPVLQETKTVFRQILSPDLLNLPPPAS